MPWMRDPPSMSNVHRIRYRDTTIEIRPLHAVPVVSVVGHKRGGLREAAQRRRPLPPSGYYTYYIATGTVPPRCFSSAKRIPTLRKRLISAHWATRVRPVVQREFPNNNPGPKRLNPSAESSFRSSDQSGLQPNGRRTLRPL